MSEAHKAVFLSYASQDAEAAKRIADALRSSGVEVWFDAEGGLEQGDEWDAKIRRQIKECVLFIAVVSGNTEAREEGYFRIEWDLAAERARGIASGVPFILPVVIDDTREAGALVPDRFRAVQWTRLKGGEVTPEVKQRFLKLWSHRTGAIKASREQGAGSRETHDRDQPRNPEPGTQNRRLSRLWIAASIAGLVIAGALGQRYLQRDQGKSEKASESPMAAAVATPPASEAGRLIERAWDIFEKMDNATKDEWELAAEFSEQATKLEPRNADAWAAYANVMMMPYVFGVDSSAERLARATKAAQRALSLDAQSVNGRVALANCYRMGDSSLVAEAERLIRALMKEQPANKRVLRMAGNVLRYAGKFEEAVAAYDRAMGLPGGDSVSRFGKERTLRMMGRFAEAEALVDEVLALDPGPPAQLRKIYHVAVVRDDLPQAAELLEKIPAEFLLGEEGTNLASMVWMWRRDADRCIAVLKRYAGDRVLGEWKGGIVGLAYSLSGRPDAARLEWQAAVRLVDARLAEVPGDTDAIFQKIMLLAALGDKAGAEALRRTYLQLRPPATGTDYFNDALMQLMLERFEEAVSALEKSIEIADNPLRVVNRRAQIRHHPIMDPLRSRPRFHALLQKLNALPIGTAAPAKPVAAARDWPRDPELRKAFEIITALDTSAESSRLAEDLVNSVLKQRPTDPEATTVYAMVNNYFLNRGFDNSDDRLVLARRFSERALQLSPDHPEAMAAMAQFLTFRRSDLARAEQLIRQAIALAPDEPRFSRILVYNVLYGNRTPDAVAEGKAASLRFPNDPLTHYNLALICRATGDMVLMEQSLDRTLALAPVGSAMIWKGWLTAWVHGDLPGFRTWLDKITGSFRVNERAIYMRYVYACLSGDANYGLHAVQSHSGTWLNDFYYNGPRSLLAADLFAIQGRKELAREEYERALAEIRRRMAANPNDQNSDRAELWALLGLGRVDEARTIARKLHEQQGRPYWPIYMLWWHSVIPAQLLTGNRTEALALMKEAAMLPAIRQQLRTALQIDPRMAPFRNDAEIQAILAEPKSDAVPAKPKADDKSVAVLAFANLSDDKANEYFSDGISEELLNVLAKVPGLKVSARTSAFFFKGKEVPIPEIARQLGVAYVVEGSVRKAGDKVRITAQLIKAADGFHVWSDTFTRDLKDVFAVQDEIAGLVAKNLQIQMGIGAPNPRREIAPAALEEYLAGRSLAATSTVGGLRESIVRFRRAVASEPGFAGAWVQIARSYVHLSRWGGLLSPAEWEETRQAVGRAEALEPGSPEVQLALGWVRRTADWNWKGAEVAFREALRLRPDHAETLAGLAVLLANLGREQEAVAAAQRAAALDPLNASAQMDLLVIFYCYGRYADAVQAGRRAMALAPGSLIARSWLARSLVELDRLAEAEAEMNQEENWFSRTGALARLRAKQGRLEEARALLREMEVRADKIGGAENSYAYLANVWGIVGDAKRGMDFFEKTRDIRDPSIAWARTSFYASYLKNDPRWPDFLRSVGLADDQLK